MKKYLFQKVYSEIISEQLKNKKMSSIDDLTQENTTTIAEDGQEVSKNQELDKNVKYQAQPLNINVNLKNEEDQENDQIKTDQSLNTQYQITFSPNMANQFSETVNSFTKICAEMVNERNIDKDLYQKFDMYYSKIKNLIEASKNK